MSDTANMPEYPWDAFQGPAPTAHPPANIDLPDNPWDTFGPSPTHNLSDRTPDNFLEPQASDNPPVGAEVPFEQRLANNIQTVGAGMGIGELAGVGITKGAGMFKNVPDLLDAGIRPKTLQTMTPAGINPAEFAHSLKSSLNKEEAIGKNAADTWNKMHALKEQAGQDVGSALEAIGKTASSSGTNPLVVPAEQALKPVLEGWTERASGATTARKAMAKPFEQVYSALVGKAANQGGMLTLDDLRGAMDEIGPMTHKGAPQIQEAMSELYGVLANARDAMVNTVAKQASDPALASNLLGANARYSKYVRLMPDVTAHTTKEAIKEGISAFQKYGGPILKYGGGVLVGLTGEEALKKLYGMITGGGE